MLGQQKRWLYNNTILSIGLTSHYKIKNLKDQWLPTNTTMSDSSFRKKLIIGVNALISRTLESKAYWEVDCPFFLYNTSFHLGCNTDYCWNWYICSCEEPLFGLTNKLLVAHCLSCAPSDSFLNYQLFCMLTVIQQLNLCSDIYT